MIFPAATVAAEEESPPVNAACQRRRSTAGWQSTVNHQRLNFRRQQPSPEKANFSEKVMNEGRKLPATLSRSFVDVLVQKQGEQQQQQNHKSGESRFDFLN